MVVLPLNTTSLKKWLVQLVQKCAQSLESHIIVYTDDCLGETSIEADFTSKGVGFGKNTGRSATDDSYFPTEINVDSNPLNADLNITQQI